MLQSGLKQHWVMYSTLIPSSPTPHPEIFKVGIRAGTALGDVPLPPPQKNQGGNQGLSDIG